MYETQPLEMSVIFIWLLMVIQGLKGHKINWKILCDFMYVLHTNIGHIMHRFWDVEGQLGNENHQIYYLVVP